MISSVSNVNFRGDTAPVNNQDLINSPGKFTTQQAPKADAPADSFEKEGAAAEKKKSKAPAIIGTIVGLLAAAYVGLTVAVNKKVLTKAVEKEGQKLGFMDKVKNFFFKIGESGDNLWKKIRGVKADDIDGKPKNDAPDIKKPSTDSAPKTEGDVTPKTEGGSAPKTGGEDAPKTEGGSAPKTEGEEAPKTEG